MNRNATYINKYIVCDQLETALSSSLLRYQIANETNFADVEKKIRKRFSLTLDDFASTIFKRT